jgi:hypothetical protein
LVSSAIAFPRYLPPAIWSSEQKRVSSSKRWKERRSLEEAQPEKQQKRQEVPSFPLAKPAVGSAHYSFSWEARSFPWRFVAHSSSAMPFDGNNTMSPLIGMNVCPVLSGTACSCTAPKGDPGSRTAHTEITARDFRIPDKGPNKARFFHP